MVEWRAQPAAGSRVSGLGRLQLHGRRRALRRWRPGPGLSHHGGPGATPPSLAVSPSPHRTGTGSCRTSSKHCCCAICRRSSAKAILRADAPPSKNCTPRTAPFFFPWAATSATRRWIRSLASCEPVIRASSTRRTAPRKRFRMGDASRGDPDEPSSRPLHWARRHHRTRREDCHPLRLPRLAARMKLDTVIDGNRVWMRNLVIGSRKRASAGVSDRIVALLRWHATPDSCDWSNGKFPSSTHSNYCQGWG
jgi:hypothetical protein